VSKRVGQLQVLILIVQTSKAFNLYMCVTAGLCAILISRMFKENLSDRGTHSSALVFHSYMFRFTPINPTSQQNQECDVRKFPEFSTIRF
jgi:hypothetical protein